MKTIGNRSTRITGNLAAVLLAIMSFALAPLASANGSHDRWGWHGWSGSTQQGTVVYGEVVSSNPANTVYMFDALVGHRGEVTLGNPDGDNWSQGEHDVIYGFRGDGTGNDWFSGSVGTRTDVRRDFRRRWAPGLGGS